MFNHQQRKIERDQRISDITQLRAQKKKLTVNQQREISYLSLLNGHEMLAEWGSYRRHSTEPSKDQIKHSNCCPLDQHWHRTEYKSFTI